jgi:hypothetical protein
VRREEFGSAPRSMPDRPGQFAEIVHFGAGKRKRSFALHVRMICRSWQAILYIY